jgi:hypothetical protein
MTLRRASFRTIIATRTPAFSAVARTHAPGSAGVVNALWADFPRIAKQREVEKVPPMSIPSCKSWFLTHLRADRPDDRDAS